MLGFSAHWKKTTTKNKQWSLKSSFWKEENRNEPTWISEVEVVLDVTCYIFMFFVLSPVGIRLLIVTDKNSKQDDHGGLPHDTNCWKAQADVGVFRAVAHLPEALTGSHGFSLELKSSSSDLVLLSCLLLLKETVECGVASEHPQVQVGFWAEDTPTAAPPSLLAGDVLASFQGRSSGYFQMQWCVVIINNKVA